jgi:hypothetical protein
MEGLKGKFTRIQEQFSTARRMPRLGRIRLGIKVQKVHKGTGQPIVKDGKPIEYPKETPYFVVPEEVARVYGDQPTELDVMLPHDDPEIIFPQKLAWYGSTRGLKCHGNGQTAERYDEKAKQWQPIDCPCEHRKTDLNPAGECTEQAHLMVLLPKVSLGGVYQITTRSYHSVVDINSALDYIRMLVGRIALVPLKLRREARTTHHDGKAQTHYTMSLVLDADVNGLNKLREDSRRVLATARYMIEAPIEENPAVEPPDAIDETEEDVLQIEGATVPDPQPEKAAMPTAAAPVPPFKGPASAAAPAEAPTAPLAGPVTGSGSFDADWLSNVLDAEDYLRSSADGKNLLRSIREGFKLADGAYPLLPEQQTEYYETLKRTVVRLERRTNK